MRTIFNHLHKFQGRHFEKQRVGKALAIAIPTIAVGNWLLHFEVSNLGLDPVWAYRTNWPIITFLCFVLNRAFTWSDRKNGSIIKWMLVSLLHSGLNQYLYPKLVGAGMHYYSGQCIAAGIEPGLLRVQQHRHIPKGEEDRYGVTQLNFASKIELGPPSQTDYSKKLILA